MQELNLKLNLDVEQSLFVQQMAEASDISVEDQLSLIVLKKISELVDLKKYSPYDPQECDLSEPIGLYVDINQATRLTRLSKARIHKISSSGSKVLKQKDDLDLAHEIEKDRKMGSSVAELAKKYKRSAPSIYQYLNLAKAPEEIKANFLLGKLTLTQFINKTSSTTAEKTSPKLIRKIKISKQMTLFCIKDLIQLDKK